MRGLGLGERDEEDEGREEGEGEVEEREEEERDGVAVLGREDDLAPPQLPGEDVPPRVEPATAAAGEAAVCRVGVGRVRVVVVVVIRQRVADEAGGGCGAHKVGYEGREEVALVAVGRGEVGAADRDRLDVFRRERVEGEVEEEAAQREREKWGSGGDDEVSGSLCGPLSVVTHRVRKQDHWTKTWAMPSTDSKHWPADWGGKGSVELSLTRAVTRARTRYWQQATWPHWRVTMLPRDEAELVAPRRRKRGL